jgi:hypothetical protein
MLDWQPIENAPFDVDLELAVLEGTEAHALIFPCRRDAQGWLKCGKKRELVDVHPTHWRRWKD